MTARKSLGLAKKSRSLAQPDRLRAKLDLIHGQGLEEPREIASIAQAPIAILSGCRILWSRPSWPKARDCLVAWPTSE